MGFEKERFAYTKPLVFEVSFFDGGRETPGGMLSGVPHLRTEFEGPESSGFT